LGELEGFSDVEISTMSLPSKYVDHLYVPHTVLKGEKSRVVELIETVRKMKD